MGNNNKFDVLDGRPPPLFIGEKEKDLAKQITDELIERVIGQVIAYFPIDLERTNFHPLYGEAIEKTFLNPIKVNALIEWLENPTKVTNYGSDQITNLKIHFHKRRLTEDQNLYVRLGDFVSFGDSFYEIVQLEEPRLLWGQINSKIEITAKCAKARQDLFNNAD